MSQLTLNVTLPDALSFDSFLPIAENEDIVRLLASGLWQDFPQLFVYGDPGCGKSHLLQACCYAASQHGRTAAFLSMQELSRYGTDVLTGLHSADLLVVDDIDALIGNKTWEEALFHLINSCRQNNQALLMSAGTNPHELNCLIPDLASRLLWGPIYRIYQLNDDQALSVFKWRAQKRGLEIPDAVINYISKRHPRDIQSLIAILDQLDSASLHTGKKVTLKLLNDAVPVDTANLLVQ